MKIDIDRLREFVSLLKKIDNDEGFIIGMALLVKEYGITEETIEYIRTHPEVDSEKIANFIMYEDYDGECKIDRQEV